MITRVYYHCMNSPVHNNAFIFILFGNLKKYNSHRVLFNLYQYEVIPQERVSNPYLTQLQLKTQLLLQAPVLVALLRPVTVNALLVTL